MNRNLQTPANATGKTDVDTRTQDEKDYANGVGGGYAFDVKAGRIVRTDRPTEAAVVSHKHPEVAAGYKPDPAAPAAAAAPAPIGGESAS